MNNENKVLAFRVGPQIDDEAIEAAREMINPLAFLEAVGALADVQSMVGGFARAIQAAIAQAQEQHSAQVFNARAAALGAMGAQFGQHALAEAVEAFVRAAQAIGKALWEGAEALAEYAIGVSLAANPFTAALAPGHFAAAAAHTTAAIAYGALGGAAAIGGRLVAGSAFSDSSASAGSGSVAGNAFGSSTGSGSTADSGPRVISENRNSISNPPQPQRIDLHVHVSGQVDNAKMVGVVAEAMNPSRGLPNHDMHDAVVNIITHEYGSNNPRLNVVLQDAYAR